MSANQFTYRRGNLHDLDELQNLAIAAYSQFKTVLTPENWQTFHNNLQVTKMFSDLLQIAVCFVCVDNNAIVGAAYLIPRGNPTDIFKTEWAYIRMVGIHPKYEGKGIAKNLTALCIREARAKHEHVIALHTSEFMDAARHVYEKAGFKKLKEIAPRFGKKYWLYTLEL